MKKRIICANLIFLILIISLIGILIFTNKKEKMSDFETTIQNTTNSGTSVNRITETSEVIITEAKNDEGNTKIEETTKKIKTTEKKKETTTKKVQVVNSTTTKKVVEETTVKKTNVWDKYGVTEDEYYNKPVYKWERVDFSVSKYGSEKETRKACLEHGDNYQPYINGEELYNCQTVYSLSGKYLGEMFITTKIQ